MAFEVFAVYTPQTEVAVVVCDSTVYWHVPASKFTLNPAVIEPSGMVGMYALNL